MNKESNKIKSFTDLNSWRMGHKLVLIIYKITSSFPKEEIFGLSSQMRRCAVSITSNIAEGFNRESFKDKIRFYYMALGSTAELQNQILISKDINYIEETIFLDLSEKSIIVHKMINGLIKKSKTLTHNS